MDDISNKTLAILLVTAIVASLSATMFTLTKLDTVSVTGQAATPSSGNVSMTVETSESFILRVSELDFGSGFVNTSHVTADGGLCNNATLFAGQSYNDTNDNDCWDSFNAEPSEPTSFELENDGNVNLTIQVTAENSTSFFGIDNELANLTWRSRSNESGGCASGAQANYIDFQDYVQTVCDDFLYQPASSDSIAVDVRMIIPASGISGTYENATVEFTGSQS